jgi:isopenicillin N synthase-like dioxygenase
MSHEFELPIIDISAFTTDSNSRTAKLKVAKQIYEACRNVGFFYLIGHNVPQEIIDKVLKLGYEFFHLPEEEKIKYSIVNEDHARLFINKKNQINLKLNYLFFYYYFLKGVSKTW